MDQMNDVVPARRSRRSVDWPLLLTILALLVATIALYWPVTGYDFIDFDDGGYVYANEWVNTGLSWGEVRWAFTTVHEAWWLPMLWISFMADTELFGTGPFGYHLTNVVLFGLNVVLLFWVLHRMTGARWRSALVAAFFAIHPLRVESVAWITERKDVLSGLFWMLALLAYLRQVEKPSRLRYWTVPLLMLLGLMSKAILVALPPVLLLLDYWPLRRADSPFRRDQWPVWWRLFKEKTPLWLLALVFIGINAKTHTTGSGFIYGLSFLNRVLLIFPNYWRYLAKIFWPGQMGILYPENDAVYAPASLLALGGLLAATGGFLWLSRRHRFAGVGWLWFGVCLFPVIRGVRLGLAQYADRWTYLPSIGLALLLVWAVAEWAGARRARRALALGVAALLLAASGWSTARQLRRWENSETLFRHTLGFTGENTIIRNNLGGYLLEKGRLAEAEAEFRRVIDVDPTFALPQGNLGAAHCISGRFEDALAYLRTAIQLDPEYKAAALNLGGALYMLGRFEEAIAQFRRVLQMSPQAAAAAHYNIGNAHYELGRYDQALESYEAALQARPRYLDALCNRGNAYYRLGRGPEALESYRAALALDANHFNTLQNLANVQLEQQELDQAEELYRRTVALQPTNAAGFLGLGRVARARGRLDEAAERFQSALALDSNLVARITTEGDRLFRQGLYPEAEARYREVVFIFPSNSLAYNNLGNALCSMKRQTEALEAFEAALRLDPDYALAYFNLGNALLELGRHADAVRRYDAALRLDPDQWEAAVNRGRALCALGQMEEGLAAFRQVLDRDPENLSAAINSENVLFQLGRLPEAEAMAARAVELARTRGGADQVARTVARLNSRIPAP